MSRNLLLAQVVGVKDQNTIYPSCKYCYSKVYSHGAGEEIQWRCIKCKTQFPESDINYRFRIHVVITDESSFSDVSVFGSNLEQMFGCTAYQFKKYLDHNEETSAVLSSALDEVFVGRLFLFGFKSQPIRRRSSLAEFNKPLSLSTVLSHAFPRQNSSGQPDKQQTTASLVAFQMLPAPTPENSTPMPTVLKTLRKKIQAKIRHLGGEVQLSNPNQENSFSESSSQAIFLRPVVLDTPATDGRLANSFAHSYGQKSVILSCDKDSSSFFENKSRNNIHFESYLHGGNEDESSSRGSSSADERSKYAQYNMASKRSMHSGYHEENFSNVDFESTFETSPEYSSSAQTDCLENDSYYLPKGKELPLRPYIEHFSSQSQDDTRLENDSANFESLELPRSESPSLKRLPNHTFDNASQLPLELPNVSHAYSTAGSVGTCVLEKLSLGVSRNGPNPNLITSKLQEEMIPEYIHDHDSMFDETFDPNEIEDHLSEPKQISTDHGQSCPRKEDPSNIKREGFDSEISKRNSEVETEVGGMDMSSASDSDSFLLLACQAVPTQEGVDNSASPNFTVSTEKSEDASPLVNDLRVSVGDKETEEEGDREKEPEEGWVKVADDSDTTTEDAISFTSQTGDNNAAPEEMPFSEDLDAFLNGMTFSEELEFDNENLTERRPPVHELKRDETSSLCENSTNKTSSPDDPKKKELVILVEETPEILMQRKPSPKSENGETFSSEDLGMEGVVEETPELSTARQHVPKSERTDDLSPRPAPVVRKEEVCEGEELPMSEDMFFSQEGSEGGIECHSEGENESEEGEISSSILSGSECLFSSESELFSATFSSYSDDTNDEIPPTPNLPKPNVTGSSKPIKTVQFSNGPLTAQHSTRRRKSVHFAGTLINVETIPVIDRQMKETPLLISGKSRRRSCLTSADSPDTFRRSFLSSQPDLFSPSPEIGRLRQSLANLRLHSTPVHDPQPTAAKETNFGSDIIPSSSLREMKTKPKGLKPHSTKVVANKENLSVYKPRLKSSHPVVNLHLRNEYTNDCDTTCDLDDSDLILLPSQDVIKPCKKLAVSDKNVGSKIFCETRNNLHVSSAEGNEANISNGACMDASSSELFSSSEELFSDCSWASEVNDSVCKKLF